MTPCDTTERALAGALALEDIDAAALRHAESCPECGALLARSRSYALLTTRARRAVEAQGDLSPNAWARIRATVDEAPARRRAWGRWSVGLAAIAAAVLAWVVLSDRGASTDATRVVASAVGGLALPEAPVVATAPAAARDADGRRLALGPGDLVEAPAERTITAFGRHHVTLAAGTTLRVLSWSERKMTLELVRGSVTSDVTRAAGEDLYEVQTPEATVRVLGTIFTVSRAEGAETTDVSVARGKVSVTDSAGVEQLLTVGQRATVAAPATALEEPGEDAAPDTDTDTADAGAHPAPRVTPRKRVIEIDVPSQRMAAPAFDGERALRAIEFAIVRGRCDAAMKALATLETSAGEGKLPAARVADLRARCAPPAAPTP
ncbi:MAG: FecR domain-containing protein [Deltaproteobacteria bacterium]|nr:FecR domain-containing protein [Deltaproteobacteria bacterium]